MTLTLDGPLGLDSLAPLLEGRRPGVRLGPEGRGRMLESRRVVERVLERGETVYGVNTGFGKLSRLRISGSQLAALQVNLLRSHACGVGPPLPAPTVRTMMVLRARSLAVGFSGVRPELVERLVALYLADVVPVVPAQGSVGASGDLAPLAHLALVLIGEGEAFHRGERRSGADALAAAGVEPLRLQAKEGLSLINGTQLSTALTAEAVWRAERLARTADLACALTVDGLKGTDRAFDARIQKARGHVGQELVATNLRQLLEGSAILSSHEGCDRVQDPYSLRCAPQVHGACRDQLAEARRVVEIEIDAVTDNPLVFPDTGEVISGGNFHGQPVAAAADRVAAAVTDLASIVERRVENLVNPDLSELPAFLAPDPGLCSGFMIAQVVAAALVSECKSQCFPASVDSIPTSANKEDHVSMGPIAARKALRVVECAEKVVAIELLAAAQALDFETERGTSEPLQAVHRFLRRHIPSLREDRPLSGEIEQVAGWVRSGALLEAAAETGAAIR